MSSGIVIIIAIGVVFWIMEHRFEKIREALVIVHEALELIKEGLTDLDERLEKLEEKDE